MRKVEIIIIAEVPEGMFDLFCNGLGRRIEGMGIRDVYFKDTTGVITSNEEMIIDKIKGVNTNI